MAYISRPVAFVLAASDHGTLIVNRHDYRMVTETAGYGMGFQILNKSSYDPEEISSVLDLLVDRRETFGDGVVAIDCGANIGIHTVEWAKRMHGWGSVVAIEAQERIFYALAGNLAVNNCFNARAIFAAVGANSGEMLVPVPDYLKPASFGSLELVKRDDNEFIGQPIDYSREKSSKVSLITIDSLGLNRVDLIKIDVEGMELEVLYGAFETVEKNKPRMLIESVKTDQAELRALLEGFDYRIFPAGMNFLAIHASDPIVEKIQVS